MNAPISLVIINAAGAAISILIAVKTLQKKSGPLATYLMLLLVSAAIWAGGVALEHAAATLGWGILWVKVQYIGALTCPVFFLLLSLEYHQLSHWVNARNLVLLFAMPAITLLLSWTNELHSLVWTSVSPPLNGGYLTSFGYGIMFWVGVIGYSYLVLIAGTAIFLRYSLKNNPSQTVLILMAVLFPWLANLIYILNISPVPGLELTPAFVVISGLIFYLSLEDDNNLPIVQKANSLEILQAVFNTTPDSLSIIHLATGRFVDVNEGFTTLSGYTREEAIGRSTVDLDIWQNPQDRLRFDRTLEEQGYTQKEEILFRCKDGTIKTGLVFAKIVVLAGEPHIVSVAHDITEQKRAAELALKFTTIEERQRLARDLHDSVNQSIHGLVLFSETLVTTLGRNNPDRARQIADRIQESARQALKETRLLLYQLQPVDQAEGVDLIRDLEARLLTVERHAGVRAQIVQQGSIDLCPREWHENLFWIAIEALNNAMKHAQCRNIDILIQCRADQICLEVADNGIGFDPSVSRSGGFGLRNIRDRAALLGGSIEIISRLNEGSWVRFTAPLGAGREEAFPETTAAG